MEARKQKEGQKHIAGDCTVSFYKYFHSVWILLSQSYQAVVEKQDEPDLYVLQEFLPNWEPPQSEPQGPVESLVKMH